MTDLFDYAKEKIDDRRQRKPAKTPPKIGLLIELLARDPGLTRSVIAQKLDWTERDVRLAVELAGGLVLSAPGIRGFRLATHVSVSDYQKHERRAMVSTISNLQKKLIKMDQCVYGN